MRRGTTPSITIEVNGLDLTNCEEIEVSFKQDNQLLNKKLSEGDIEINPVKNQVVVKLTQEETLNFKATQVSVQLKVKISEGNVGASEILIVKIKDILDESVM